MMVVETVSFWFQFLLLLACPKTDATFRVVNGCVVLQKKNKRQGQKRTTNKIKKNKKIIKIKLKSTGVKYIHKYRNIEKRGINKYIFLHRHHYLTPLLERNVIASLLHMIMMFFSLNFKASSCWYVGKRRDRGKFFFLYVILVHNSKNALLSPTFFLPFFVFTSF